MRRAAGLLALMMCLCACAPSETVSAETVLQENTTGTAASSAPAAFAAADAAMLETTPAPDAKMHAHARQYGVEQRIFADGNGFSGVLRYPMGEIQPINDAMTDWAGATQYALETEAATLLADEDGMRLAIDIDYDAFLYKDRYIGVKFSGTGRAAVTGDAEQILHTYNYDLLHSSTVGLSDVIDQTQMRAVCDLLTAQLALQGTATVTADGRLTAADLQEFVMRDDGIEWLLAGDGGTTVVFLTYEQLAPYVCMTPEATHAPAGEALLASVVEQQATCLYDGVQLRALPSSREGAVIATVNTGDRLDIVQSNVTKGWHKVDHAHQTAYVNARLVCLDADEAAYTKGFVKSAYLHVRACASTDGELLGTMLYQEPVRIIDATSVDGWYKIWYEGRIAYVGAQYVAVGLYPPETQTASFATVPGMQYEPPRILRGATVAIAQVGTCATDGAIVSSAPNPQAPFYGVLAAGEQVYILQEACAPGWDRIFVYTEWNSGYVGYIPTGCIGTGASAKTAVQ